MKTFTKKWLHCNCFLVNFSNFFLKIFLAEHFLAKKTLFALIHCFFYVLLRENGLAPNFTSSMKRI